mgnify:CR=1 FL=1
MLLLSGSIALAGPCGEIVLSAVRRQERLSALATLERDIVMHNLSAPEIKNRFENELIGCELGDWAKKRIEKVRECEISLTAYCKDAEEVLQQVSELDPSLKFERKGRIRECINQLNSEIDELTKHWNPLNEWMTACLTQPFLDPYVADVVRGSRSELMPTLQNSVKISRDVLNVLSRRAEELEK